MLAMRLTHFENLIDISRIDELQSIDLCDDEVRIGAGTPHAFVGMDDEVADSVPLLTLATPYIGHFQIRTRGTLGGAIAHADPAAEYAAVALALDAQMEAVSSKGTRQIPAAEFFTGLWETSLQSGEILTAVRFPVWGGRSGFAVEEFARRHGDFAIAGAAVAVELDTDDRISRCGIGLLGLGSTPLRGRLLRTRSSAVRSARSPPRRSAGSRSAGSTTFRPTCRGRPPTEPRSAPRWWPAPGDQRPRRQAMHEWPVRVSVNGVPTEATVEPRLTLADYLRENCGLTGTHLGCEHGACGACTVHGRRPGGARMPDVRRPGGRQRGHHGGGYRRARTANCRRSSRRCASATDFSAASARPVSSCRSPLCCGTTPSPPTRRSARACPATSAGAPAIRASSTPYIVRRN